MRSDNNAAGELAAAAFRSILFVYGHNVFEFGHDAIAFCVGKVLQIGDLLAMIEIIDGLANHAATLFTDVFHVLFNTVGMECLCWL